jgi:hypothetical protein
VKLEIKTPKELSGYAHNLAKGSAFVRYRNITYAPVDFESREFDANEIPSKDRTIWLPLDRETVRRIAAENYAVLFQTDAQLSSFDFMVAQNSQYIDSTVPVLLIRTKGGLRQLNEAGILEEPSGDFVPNTVYPLLNENAKDKKRVLAVIEEWVDSKEEATSLLHHLATVLSPGWSAVKYVLLLGEGRNGKSLLLKMLLTLFGRQNVSIVTRQHMAEKNPVVTELNGKLLNLVFDGASEYLKDSGTEKSLVAGEVAPIRKLYDSTPTMVQTNALFIEGLNREPTSNDKSTALQKRLVRFLFPNVYALDHKFEKLMLSDESLGAFLAILIDHYVMEEEVAEKLAPTAKAVELQLEHMYVNSLALQYFRHLEETDPLGAEGLVSMQMSELVSKFQSWRVKENDLGTWAEPDVAAQFSPLVNTERQSVRLPGGPRKVRVITSLKPEAKSYVESLKGDMNEEALVGD